MNRDFLAGPPGRKKKVDTEALQSAFNRIPRFGIRGSRALLDLGLRDVFELEGRSPETLWEAVRRTEPELADGDLLARFRMAVYFAENPQPDPQRLFPDVWKD